MLVEVARRLAGQIRQGDTVSRYGGEEFVVVCEGLSDDREALPVARRILAEIRRPIDVGGRRITLTASIGLVGLTGLPPDGQQLIAAADEAMYAAKACGGDAVVGLGQAATPRARSQLAETP